VDGQFTRCGINGSTWSANDERRHQFGNGFWRRPVQASDCRHGPEKEKAIE